MLLQFLLYFWTPSWICLACGYADILPFNPLRFSIFFKNAWNIFYNIFFLYGWLKLYYFRIFCNVKEACLTAINFKQNPIFLMLKTHLVLTFLRQKQHHFSRVSLGAFPGCSDSVYGEISGIPTELISNPVSKFLLEKKLRSLKLVVFRL